MTTTPTSPFERTVADALHAATAGISARGGLADATRHRYRRRRARLTAAAAALMVVVLVVPAGLLLRTHGGARVVPVTTPPATASAQPGGVPTAVPPTPAPGVSGPVVGAVTVAWLPAGLPLVGTSTGTGVTVNDTRPGVRAYRADFSAMIDGRVGFVAVRAEWGPTGSLDDVATRARASGSGFDSYSEATVRGHPAIQRGNASKQEFGFTWIERDGLVLSVDGGTPITLDEVRHVAEALVVDTGPPAATPELDAAIQAAASRALRAGVPAVEAIGAVDTADAPALVAARLSFAARYPGFARTASVRLLATAPRAADRVDIVLTVTFTDPRLSRFVPGTSGGTASRTFPGEAVRTPTGWKVTEATYCQTISLFCKP
ncbi:MULTISPECIES: hypothetical protein [Pseudofrankia]|uniref:hypothetical protein n=1 Tax=Pseudofrankia TaxID=2994363 RepID=UPI000234BD11|nr:MULTISPECIES: hypothetical protein [Pseudofrankia]OHV31352.1 hypothetical protein BCD49_32005 [Pseudofrankia sp. EUN1h]